MKSRIAIAASVLTLGTALAGVPSFAQTGSAPEVKQESSGKVPQQESSACVHFQQGCSDKPYAMQTASPNGEQKSARTGTRENREARSTSSRERTSGSRVRVGERERLSGSARVSERERVSGGARVSEGTRTSDEYMRSAAPEPSGTGERVAGREGVRSETYGSGGPRYYNYAPGVQVGRAGGGTVGWCETRFHSFDPATGTYMGFDGIRHPCP